jgi:type IV secretion system protein TrbL
MDFRALPRVELSVPANAASAVSGISVPVSGASRANGASGVSVTSAVSGASGVSGVSVESPRGGRRAVRLPTSGTSGTAGTVAATAALAAAACLLPAAAAAQAPPPDSILDGVVRAYGDASSGWLERILPLAQQLFAVLATLEFAVSGLLWAAGRHSLDVVAAALLRKFLVLSFAFMLIWQFPLWLPAVARGFEAAGQTGSGTSAVNPAQILDYGVTIAGHMILSVEDAGFLIHPAGVLLGEATALVVLLAYALISVQLCMTLCEIAFVLTGGVLFLGFAGFRVTAPFAAGYLLYSFETGIKVYLLYLLVGVGTTLSQQWAAIDFALVQTPQPPTLGPQLAVMAGALVLCALVWRVGGIAGRLAHAASFRLDEALR